MARARNIKPQFFTNDQLAEIHPLGRLLFIALWTMADRAGRLEDRPKKIKAEALPYDNANVDRLLSDLQEHGFILRYEHGGARYIQVLAFAKHQNPHIREPESTIPPPDEHGAEPVPSTVSGTTLSGTGPADSPFLIPPSINETPRARSADLAIEARKHGVECHGSHPVLVVMAEQGVDMGTFGAACQKAKEAYPDERIGIGLVAKILSDWSKRAATTKVVGARPPTRASPAHAERTKAFAGRLAERPATQQPEVVDVAAVRVG